MLLGCTPIALQQPNHQGAVSTVLIESRAWGGQWCAVLTQVMASSCVNFDTQAKHSALKAEEYTPVLLV